MDQLGIKDLTHGVSANGAYDYVDGLNTGAINNAIKALQNTGGVTTALRGGWQGAAEVNFEKNLQKAVETVTDALEKIKDNIESLVSDLVEDMADQDKKLVEEENIVSFE